MNEGSAIEDDFEIINGRKIIKKHVATIHCSNKLTLLERKISNALLYHAFPKLKDEARHEITIDELKKLLNIQTRNHQVLKDSLKKLLSTVLEWNLLGDNFTGDVLEGWNASSILSSISVKGRVIEYEYSQLIKSLLVEPEIYGKINLGVQSKFRSSYALALYENCARYRGLKYTKDFKYDLFRRLMGVEEGKYKQFKDFNKRVLSPAVTEINSSADIHVTPKITKRGKRVDSIKFILGERPIKKRIGQSKALVGGEGKQSLVREFGISSGILEELRKDYGYEALDAAATYIRSSKAFKDGKITNISGYFIKAIKDGYSFETTQAANNQICAERPEIKIQDEWKNKLDELKTGLRQFQTFLDIAIESGNKLQEDNNRRMVLAYKKDIENHMLDMQEKIVQT
jgi:plasmid replication initiation protein